VRKYDGRGGQRFEQIRETNHHHRFSFGQRNQTELRLQHHAERPSEPTIILERFTGFARSTNSSRL